jgi:glycosyltransferase involved in cell wall biosynthesis
MEYAGLLFLLPFLNFGVGRLALDIMRAASARGARVYLVTGSPRGAAGNDPALMTEAKALCDDIATVDLFSRDAEAMETAEDEVSRLCVEWQIDAAHAFTAVAAAAAVTHTHVLATVVGWAPVKTQWQRAMDAEILRRCDAVTAVSNTVVDELWQAGLERPDIRVIRNGVHIPAITRRHRADAPFRTVGVHASLIERKGVDVLLRAMALVPKSPFTRLIIAGTGDAEASLRELASSLPLPCGVAWAGAMPPHQFLDEVDIAVIPSRFETLPLVLLQAMAAGVPVVASRIAGIREALRDGVDGVLVPADDPVALSLALWSAAESPNLARSRADSARRRMIHEFTLDGMLSKYFECYDEIGVPLRTPAIAGQALLAGLA